MSKSTLLEMPRNHPPTWLPQAQASWVSPAATGPVYCGCCHCVPGAEPASDDMRGLRRLRAQPLLFPQIEPGPKSLGWLNSGDQAAWALDLPPAVLLLSGY